MSRINPDPHETGYAYQPTGAVTAFLPAGHDAQPMLLALSEAGCTSENIDLFVGKEGAAQLDLAGERHGAWVRLRRAVERAFADETEVFERAEQVLQTGGGVVVVFTDEDAGQEERTAEILKTYHGEEVTYWGNMVIERL
jgi:hypothetical protein